MLVANHLGGQDRSPQYDYADWQSGAITQDCAPVRRSEADPMTMLRQTEANNGTSLKMAGWLEGNVPEGLAVFGLPEHHRRRLRT